MKATKAVVKKVKIVARKTQSFNVKKAATTHDNTKKTFTKKGEKSMSKKGELNKTPDTKTATQGDKYRT